MRREGKCHDVPTGIVYRFIAYMWNREHADYDSIMGGPAPSVFDAVVMPQTVRAKVFLVNKCLKKIGLPWRLYSDSRNRVVTKAAPKIATKKTAS